MRICRNGLELMVKSHKKVICIDIFVVPTVVLSAIIFPLRKFLERNVAGNLTNVSHKINVNFTN